MLSGERNRCLIFMDFSYDIFRATMQTERLLFYFRKAERRFCTVLQNVIFLLNHTFPYPLYYTTGTFWISNKYIFGGPRLPNTSMVINVPVLQKGHFLS